MEGSKFNAYKVESTFPGNINAAVALFKDFDAYLELFNDISELRILEDKGDEYTLYYHFNTPFPAKDRDAVFHNKMTYDRKKKQLRISISCIDSEEREKKKIIRIDDCSGYWKFTQVNKEELHLVHSFESNPKGSLPAFIINRFTTRNPIYTLKKMKKMILRPKYQGRTFSLTDNQ